MGLSKNGKVMGRPTMDNPKSFRICIRLDRQTRNALSVYCEKNGVSISEAVSIAINELSEKS